MRVCLNIHFTPADAPGSGSFHRLLEGERRESDLSNPVMTSFLNDYISSSISRFLDNEYRLSNPIERCVQKSIQVLLFLPSSAKISLKSLTLTC